MWISGEKGWRKKQIYSRSLEMSISGKRKVGKKTKVKLFSRNVDLQGKKGWQKNKSKVVL